MIWFGIALGMGTFSYIISTIETIKREQKMLRDIEQIKNHMDSQAKKIEALELQLCIARKSTLFKNELR